VLIPTRIPLNDDKQEKANRLQSRKAYDEAQLNQIKAAATPLRKRKSLGPGASPHTPAQNDGDGMPDVGGSAVTPMKRVPILANFEEWMKMATDNKINAANSWNFALIDYFHDMSLLREGDGVNFQKASCTLDGCVKIYTNRVDSVATETGKLLSGLADSGNKKKKGGEGEGEDGADGDEEDGEEDDGEGGAKKRKKRVSAGLRSCSGKAANLDHRHKG
jgi:condensin complex subunit 2